MANELAEQKFSLFIFILFWAALVFSSYFMLNVQTKFLKTFFNPHSMKVKIFSASVKKVFFFQYC